MVKEWNELLDELFNNINKIVGNKEKSYQLMELMMDCIADWKDVLSNLFEDNLPNPFFYKLEYNFGKDTMCEIRNELQEGFFEWSYKNKFLSKKLYEKNKGQFI